jgi:hypothetical protein
MKKRILAYALTLLYRIEGAIKSAQLDQAIRERNERNGWFVGAVLMLCLTVPACGPTTTQVRREQHGLRDECLANLRHIEALDAPAEERIQLYEAEGQRCRAAGLEICELHDTCGRYGR